MRKWIVGTLAVMGALSLLTVIASVGFGYWSLRQLQALETLPKSMVLAIDLREPLVEVVNRDPWSALDPSPPMAVSDVVAALDLASKDTRIRGLFARISETGHGMAVTQELRDAITRFRQTGRFAVVWADSLGELGPANEGYYLSTAFDEIYLQPGSFVGLTGLLVEVPFIPGVLDRLGIEMEVIRRAGYKTALDFVTHDELSPKNREMLEAMLDSLFGRMVDDVAEARQLEKTVLRALIDQGPLTSQAALDARLIDGLFYLDEMEEDVLDRVGKDTEIISISRYSAAVEPPQNDHATAIAFVSASGPVQRGGGDLSSAISADELADAISDARKNDNMAGLLLRLDTPGGSAVASETIAREIRLAKQQGKPVVVSMGNTAASGGYWIAMGADRIVAQPGTLTGSIGVIAGKPNLEAMWQKLDVNWAQLKRGNNADMWSLNQPYGPGARAKVEASVQQMYDRFKDGVAQGRNLDPEQVEALAQGRVWTGSDALDRGLIDRLGGLYEAQAVMRELLDLDGDAELDLYPFPPPKGPFDALSELWNLQLTAAETLRTMQTWLRSAEVWFELLGPKPVFSN